MLAAVLVSLLVAPATAGVVGATPPPPPPAYYGDLTVGGAPAPAGVTVVAVVAGETRGELTTTERGRYGGPGAFDPKLQVDGSADDDGATVRFLVDGVEAATTVQWTAGDVRELHIAVPDGTAPSSGGGSSGGSSTSGGSGGGATLPDSGDGLDGGEATPDAGDGSDAPRTVVDVATGDDRADVTVIGGRAGSSVTAPLDRSGADGDTGDGGGIGSGGFSLDAVGVTPRVDGDFTLNVTVTRDRPAGAPPFAVRGADVPFAYVVVEHSIPDADVQGATFRYRIGHALLDASGLSPEDVVLYRFAGGTWTPVPTTLVADTGTHYVFEADSPGLSVFALAGPSADGGASDADPTPTDEGESADADPSADDDAGDSDGTETPTSTGAFGPGFGALLALLALLGVAFVAARRAA